MLANLAVSALLNLVVLFAIPFAAYWGYHRWRHGRGLRETARRAGLQLGEMRYLGHAAVLAGLSVGAFLWLSPAPSAFTTGDSPQRVFAGLGLNGASVTMALLYGVVATGFGEEFLFRGLIAGSLSRRLPLIRANVAQAAIFLLPHLLILRVRPELWWLLPIVFFAALALGWLRIRSGSILGPWLVHSAVNVTSCLYVAAATVSHPG